MVHSRSANPASKFNGSNPSGFLRDRVFYDFFYFLSKNLDMKKLTEFEVLNSIVGYCDSINSGLADLTSKFECSNPFGIRDMAFLMIFFSSKNLDI